MYTYTESNLDLTFKLEKNRNVIKPIKSENEVSHLKLRASKFFARTKYSRPRPHPMLWEPKS